MRNVGYSMETSVADIIDNSIAAGAKKINIFHDCENLGPRLAIIDDGHGMAQSELVEAMRAGGQNGPLEERAPGDMGRFGLGLKTASFSQSRKLTVISRKEGTFSAACWDLDEIGNSWSLLLLDGDELHAIPWIEELPSESGTMVLWEKMDRVVKRSVSALKIREHFLEKVEAVRSHLGLVFHRFIEKSPGTVSLEIKINHLPVVPLDPYFQSYTETQKLETEIIHLRNCIVTVKPFIIPHYSKLRGVDRDSLQAQGGAAGTQGFYVYRNRRLLAWGDWFRLRRTKNEASGLARVMIDIPNALDDLWSLDIKKSSVSPPEIVRQELNRIIERITDRSTRTYTSRGQRLAERRHALWQRNISNDGVSYVLNRDQPVLVSFMETLTVESRLQFTGILQLIEKNLPVEAIHNDSLGSRFREPHSIDTEETTVGYLALIDLLRQQGIPEDKIAEVVASLRMNIKCERP
jgi:hypothetical protein